MRYLSYTFGLLTLAVFAIATMGTTSPKTVTVQGHLIDTKCYGMAANMGKPAMNYHNTHMVPGKDGEMKKLPNCATACANMGIPAGIVEGSTPGNTTYVLITPSNQLADHMDKEARVEGELAYEGGIIPQKIEVKEDGEWKEVEIATMM
jgi:hypothetical protein